MSEETNNTTKEVKNNKELNDLKKKDYNDLLLESNPLAYPFIQLMQRRQVNRSVVDLNLGERSRFYITQFALIKKEGFRGFFKGGLYYTYYWFSQSFISVGLYGLIKRDNDSTQISQLKHCFSNLLSFGISYPLLYFSNLFSLDIGKYSDETGKLISKKYHTAADIKKAHIEQYGSYKALYRGFPIFLLAQAILDPLKFKRDVKEEELINNPYYYISFVLLYPLLSLRLRQLITPNSDMSIKGTFNFGKDILKKESIHGLYEGSFPIFFKLCFVYALINFYFNKNFIRDQQSGNE